MFQFFVRITMFAPLFTKKVELTMFAPLFTEKVELQNHVLIQTKYFLYNKIKNDSW